MFELIGRAAPQTAATQGDLLAPTAVGLDDRVAAGLEFAQMLRQAEGEQASPPGTEDAVQDAPEQHETGGGATAAQGEEREDAPVEEREDAPVEEREDAPVEEREGAPAEEDEEEVAEETATTDAADTAVAVAVEVAPQRTGEGEAESEGESEGEAEREFTAVTPARIAASEGDEDVPLETDVEAEGDEGGVSMSQIPAVETDMGNPLELLNFSELIDPDLVVEKTPDQLIARISQAAATTAAPQLQEEIAETVMPQVIRSLATLVREGGAEMRLQLKPADLGEIELRVRTAEGIVRGEMMVQHPEVKQLLEHQVDRLKSALAAQGLELEGFDVNVDRDPKYFAAEAGQNRRDGRRQRVADNAPAVAPVPVAVSVGDHAVDFTT